MSVPGARPGECHPVRRAACEKAGSVPSIGAVVLMRIPGAPCYGEIVTLYFQQSAVAQSSALGSCP